MTDRQTALTVAQAMFGTDGDVLRRADLFYRFLVDTPASTMSIIFGNLIDPATQVPRAGIVATQDGRIQLDMADGFIFTAVATDAQGVAMSTFTGAVDNPDLADITLGGDGKTFTVIPTTTGSTVVTISDDNLSMSFALDITQA